MTDSSIDNNNDYYLYSLEKILTQLYKAYKSQSEIDIRDYLKSIDIDIL